MIILLTVHPVKFVKICGILLNSYFAYRYVHTD